jgi:hypothetical protein
MPFAPRAYTGGFQRVLASNKEYDRFLAGHNLKFPPATTRARSMASCIT